VVSGRTAREPNTLVGTLLGLGLVTVVTAILIPVQGRVTRATPPLALVLPVAVAAIIGRRPSALITAFAAAAALNLAFIPPHWTPKITSADDLVAFVVFVVIALVVGTLVAWEADRRVAAEQRTVSLLSRIDEQRRALLRSVSHDLRTPLAAIRAATSDMRAGVAYDDATRDELLDLVGDEAERLDRLVANLLSLSRIEAGALEPERQAVAVDELVADRVRRLARLFRHVTVQDDVPAGVPLVDADYSQLDQVVTNLLENAARHSPPGSSVSVGARCLDGRVEVWVADEGPGIDPAQVDDLFEPFQRGPGSESSGIGLAICKAIVEAHGGQIGVRPGLDGGATFWFTLPVRHD